MIIDAKKIFEDFRELFKCHNIEPLSNTIGKYYFDKSNFGSIKEIDCNKLIEKMYLIGWGIIGAQTEFGYVLISLNSYEKYNDPNTAENLKSYMLVNHHHFLLIECIYRIWERYSQVFYFIYSGKDKESGYYNQIIEKLILSEKYPQEIILKLKRHCKHWNGIAQKRNYYSHEYSNLIHGMDLNIEKSEILNYQGLPILKCSEVRSNLKSTFEEVKQKYLYIKKLHESFQEFVHFSLKEK